MFNILKRRTEAEKLICNYNKSRDRELKDVVLQIKSEIKHMVKKGVKHSHIKPKRFGFKENSDRLEMLIKTDRIMKEFDITVEYDPKWWSQWIDIKLKE